MKIKTSELEGSALDWAVAVALNGKSCFFDAFGSRMLGQSILEEVVAGNISPSTDWSQGGPLIGECFVRLETEATGWWRAIANWMSATGLEQGATPLIAACRAIVAAKLGDEIEVPDELL